MGLGIRLLLRVVQRGQSQENFLTDLKKNRGGHSSFQLYTIKSLEGENKEYKVHIWRGKEANAYSYMQSSAYWAGDFSKLEGRSEREKEECTCL